MNPWENRPNKMVKAACTFGRTTPEKPLVTRVLLQCNQLNWGHPTDMLRTKELELVHFGPITKEGQI